MALHKDCHLERSVNLQATPNWRHPSRRAAAWPAQRPRDTCRLRARSQRPAERSCWAVADARASLAHPPVSACNRRAARRDASRSRAACSRPSRGAAATHLCTQSGSRLTAPSPGTAPPCGQDAPISRPLPDGASE
eukprot:scaffold8813_cov96-Isochrysis_galbana.AAC.2